MSTKTIVSAAYLASAVAAALTTGSLVTSSAQAQ